MTYTKQVREYYLNNQDTVLDVSLISLRLMRPLTICFPAIRTACLKRSFRKSAIRMLCRISLHKKLAEKHIPNTCPSIFEKNENAGFCFVGKRVIIDM